MRIRRKILTASFIITIIGIMLISMVWTKNRPNYYNAQKEIIVSIKTDCDMIVQMFSSDVLEFSDENASVSTIEMSNTYKDISLPFQGAPGFFRFDFGDENARVFISNIKLKVDGVEQEIPLTLFINPALVSDIEKLQTNADGVEIVALAPDPYVVIEVSELKMAEIYENESDRKYFLCNIFLTVWTICLVLFCLKNIEAIFRMPLDIFEEREMFWDLAGNDFQAKFSGSYLGVFWGFAQPIILLLLYWFVFQYGMRAGNVVGYPFILYLMAGLIPWFFFSEAWSGATNSLLEYNYLVKKVVFKVNLLPVLKVISSAFIHLFFVGVLLIVCCIYGFYPTIYSLQLIYYACLLVLLSLGMSYITAACTVFFRDMSQIVNIALTVGVWFTPIMWSVTLLGPALQIVFKSNPMFYIVDGFRDSLLVQKFFWEKPVWTVYSVSVIILVYIYGVKLYNRLKIHFADVL